MTIEEIHDKGLLESYLIGDISFNDKNLVIEALNTYPELRDELRSMETAIQAYATAHAVPVSPELKEKILKIARINAVPHNLSKGDNEWKKLALLLGIGVVGLLLAFFWKANALKQLQSDYNAWVQRCDSIQAEQDRVLLVYEQIKDTNNRIIPIQPTEKYPTTNLYFHNNESTGRNYIQLKNLPALADNQSFQLWSLKGDQAIPLNVFQGDGELIFEVEHVEETDAYAITIEPRGGQDTPSLDNLIGVIPLS
jgi:anti-sigma-K factor RskA